MRATWLFVSLLASGMCGLTVWAVDEPAKETSKVPDGWVDYVPMHKMFGVYLPKGGKRTERTDTIPVGNEKVSVNVLELESDGKGKFFARSIYLQMPKPMIVKGKIIKPPPGPTLAEQQAIGEAMRDGFVKKVGGKIADEKDVTFGNKHKGKEYEITIDDKLRARLRVFVLGGLIHQYGILGTKEQVEGKDADTFFESYRMPREEERLKKEQEKEKEKDKDKDKDKQ